MSKKKPNKPKKRVYVGLKMDAFDYQQIAQEAIDSDLDVSKVIRKAIRYFFNSKKENDNTK